MTPLPRLWCTLGTSTDDPAVLRAIVDAGAGMLRLNTAYATIDEIGRRIDAARPLAPVLLDLKGRQLRVDCTTTKADPRTGEPVERPCRYPIDAGDRIVVGFRTGPVRFNHDFAADLQPGDLVTFDNGRIRARALDFEAAGYDVVEHAVLLEVIDPGDGRLNPQVGANVPGRRLHVPSLTDRDRQAIEAGVDRGVHAYALSFVQAGADLLLLHQVLLAHGDATSMLVPKIEDEVGIAALEEIVATARAAERPVAVMIARGDLFVELPPARLPAVQDDLVRRCALLGVPSVVATGLLLSMTDSPRPTRAEVCDVAAALRQGASALMLSDETSNSRHPVEAVRLLSEMIGAYGC